MRYFLLYLLVFLATISFGQNHRQGQDHALFFAIHEYQDSKLSDLPNTIQNAEAIASILKERYNFDTVIVRNPSLQQIRSKLNSYRDDYKTGQRPKGGQLLIFFSGHGVKQYSNGYFLPADADPDDVISTAIAYDSWRPFISEINCKHILVAIDACYSVTFDPDWKMMSGGSRFERPGGELSDEERLMANHSKYPARLFMTSDAKEDVVPGRSNFTRKFLEGLSLFQGRFLTANELFASTIKKAQPSPRDGDFEQDDPRSSFLFFPKNERPKIDAAQYNNRQSDILAYGAIKRGPSIENCQQYLQEFPGGNFRLEVSQQLQYLQDEQEWQLAQLKDTPASYQAYLKLFPKGQYATQARSRVNRSKKKTAKDVIKDYIQAIGGEAALSSVKDMTIAMSTSVQGMNMEMKRVIKNGKMLVKVTASGMVVNEIKFDGGKASVSQMGQTQEADPTMVENFKEDAIVFPELVYATLGKNLSLKEDETIDGKNVYVIEVESESGKRQTKYFDIKSGLKVRSQSNQNGTLLQTDYSDYREVEGGIKMPFKIVSTGQMPNPLSFEVQSVALNTGVSDAVFKVK